ncbi:hypothetical protein Q4E93_13095 [Flavitalea sp. BT771]|uniref:hypothetical protein n=1 Tax=Flavitalea sp. BT771 TaxID=3063329 RepID=UPI0026E3D982|nr:hypothetical protein [Flavitalea sp. BT771]MDO6431534.1 hypothetical protein [Flavitalea sp. BT771]MDV6220442.1 hypothetical protein [Flavitalea sp. BT771]
MPDQLPVRKEYQHLPEQKKSVEEYIRSAVKASANFLPLVGGPLAELIDSTWVPHHVKKMEEWYASVDETLRQLLEQGRITMEQLYADERFASIFQKTSKAYLDNVEAFKRPALQSALKAALTKEIPLDKKYLFLRMIEDLSEAQLLILKDVYDNSKSDDYKYQQQIESELSAKYAGGDDQYFALLKKGLESYHLLSYSSTDVVQNDGVQWNMVPSTIGTEFLEYITSE